MPAHSLQVESPPSSIAALVIGGSAGALEVLRALLQGLRIVPVPVVIVIHLSARSPDSLPELLAHDCVLPVKQAEDKEPLQPGVVYVAPPGYHLLIESHRAFALSVDEPVHFSRPAIDVTFESAAHAYGRQLLAVLLSGASADGAAGMQDVHAAGGMTVVQTPQSADSPTMPAAALALFNPTYSWSAAEIVRKLPALLDTVHASSGSLR